MATWMSNCLRALDILTNLEFEGVGGEHYVAQISSYKLLRVSEGIYTTYA